MATPVDVGQVRPTSSIVKVTIQTTIAQDRLDSLALISIENETARQLNLEEVLDKFAHSKAYLTRDLRVPSYSADGRTVKTAAFLPAVSGKHQQKIQTNCIWNREA